MARENLDLIVGAKDKGATALLKRVGGAVIGVSAAYAGMRKAADLTNFIIGKTLDYQAAMVSLKSVAGATGRDLNKIYASIDDQVYGVADRLSITQGMLKGLTTELSVEQIGNLTTSIRDASLAMGEDFRSQFPLIIRAIKQLNPAILDNIGVTVRLDEVNKRIRDGYYGVGTAINEATQQNAIYQEVMKQTAKFAGQEGAYLTTVKGQWDTVKATLSDLALAVGTKYAPQIKNVMAAIVALTAMTKFMVLNGSELWGALFKSIKNTITNMIKMIKDYVNALKIAGYAAKFMAESIIDPSKWKHFDDVVAHTAKQFAKVGVDIFNMAAGVIKDIIEITPLALSAVDDAIKEFMPAYTATMKKFSQEIVTPPTPENVKGTIKNLNKIKENTIEVVDVMERDFRKLGDTMGSITQSAVNQMIDAWWEGAKVSSEIWNNMAKDFAKFFTQQALAGLADMFVPGLGRLLGGIFDTPKYDRMAMTQGEHYVQWMTRGMEDEFARQDVGNFIAESAGANLGGLPATSGAGSINNYYGVVADDFVNQDVVPTVSIQSRRNQVTLFATTNRQFGLSRVFS